MRSWHNGSYHTASPFQPAGIAPQLKTLLHAHAQQAKWRAPAFQGLFAYAYVERPCGVVTVAGALHIAYMVKDSFHGSSVTPVGRSWIKLKHLAKDTLLIAATMCLALAGCGTSPVGNNANADDNEQSSFETVQSKGGGSSSSLLMFSKSAWRNAMIAMKIGFEVSLNSKTIPRLLSARCR